MTVIVFGATGLLGSAIAKKNPGCIKLNSKDFDATNKTETMEWFHKNTNIVHNSVVHICCGKVSGIGGQKNRIMLQENLDMATNLINALAKYQSVGNTVYYSSSCVYPKHLDNFLEKDMLTGSFEQSNEGYALAKSVGQKLCEYWNSDLQTRKFIVIVPPNLWGDNDNWDIETSHVLPALAQKIWNAKKNNQLVEVWGEPDTRREFLCSEDVAEAVQLILSCKSNQTVFNVGMGTDISISEIVNGLANRLEYNGDVSYTGHLTGKKRKLMQSLGVAKMGWKPKYSYEDMLDYISDYVKQL